MIVSDGTSFTTSISRTAMTGFSTVRMTVTTSGTVSAETGIHKSPIVTATNSRTSRTTVFSSFLFMFYSLFLSKKKPQLLLQLLCKLWPIFLIHGLNLFPLVSDLIIKRHDSPALLLILINYRRMNRIPSAPSVSEIVVTGMAACNANRFPFISRALSRLFEVFTSAVWASHSGSYSSQ